MLGICGLEGSVDIVIVFSGDEGISTTLLRTECTLVRDLSGVGIFIPELTWGLYTTDSLFAWAVAFAIASVRLVVMTGVIFGGSFILTWVMFTGFY